MQPIKGVAVRLLVAFLAVSNLYAGPTARLSEAEAIAQLKSELTKESAEDMFSGAVLIAKAGKPVFEAAYGYADRERKIINTVDTKFRFGSMGKMFTAVAVLQLVQGGKIKLDDPLSTYLPDYPNKQVARVTIHQLLTHTGGTGDIFGPEYDEHRADLKELKDYLAVYGNRGLLFTPGSKWDYSNYGFILLGRVIEVVSGQSYYDYVRVHIFDPAGMASTGNSPEDQHVPDLSVGYTRGVPHMLLRGPKPGERPEGPSPPAPGPQESQANAPLRSTAGTLPYRGTSAGGGYTTVGDLLKFANALATDKLLDANYGKLLTTGKVSTPRPGTKYAYGFEDQTTPNGIRFFGHGGGAPGMNGRLAVFPGSGYVVAVLANFDPPAADDVARFIEDRLPPH
jgi:D-alanyl-D-alanine carboxypeptidase